MRKPTISVWPEPKERQYTGGCRAISFPLRVETRGRAAWLSEAAHHAEYLLNRAAAGRDARRENGGPTMLTVATMEALPRGLEPILQEEGYVLSITPEEVLLAGQDARGTFWGAQTLVQLLDGSESLSLPLVTMRDWPRYPIRAVHCYLPSQEQMAFFWRFLDFLSLYKFNTLILEIAGGMEYEKHPEINAAWSKFCEEARAYDFDTDPHIESKKSQKQFNSHLEARTGPEALQASRYFWKDSTHTELAGGSWLTKEEVRRIKRECDARHIAIIPEVQALSHAYYLCCAHPEIAERMDDPWPDTYCPSNPKSYELLFDVMDEVIEVFRPRIMHVGHDEAYTFAVCPRCRERTGHDILAGDIQTIHDFLATRGVRMCLWGDKLMHHCYGGNAFRNRDADSGKTWYIPATWRAIETAPKDLLVCDWYWSLQRDSEHYFHRYGFEVVYGNFMGNGLPENFPDWEKRADASFVLGAEVSTWCEVSAYAFGHNHVPFQLFKAADMLWQGRQIEDEPLSALMASHLASRWDVLRGEARWLVSGGEGELAPIGIGPAARGLPRSLAGKLRTGKRLQTSLGTGDFAVLATEPGFLARAVVLDRKHPTSMPLLVGRKARKLLLLHGTTMRRIYLRPTYYSYHRGPAELLRGLVAYSDGTQETFSAYFGDDIGPIVGRWPTDTGGYCHRSLSVPAGADHTFFAQEWTNPRPDVAIASLMLILGADAAERGQVIVAALSTLG